MSRRNYSLALLLICASLLVGCGQQVGPDGVAEGAQVGARLPDAELTTFAGEKVRVHEMRGGPVVINFWATWCGPCKAEIPMLQQAYEATDRTGFQLLAITDERPSQVRDFVAEFGMSFPVLFDAGGGAARRYQVQAIPTTLFIDEAGIVVARHTGALDERLLQTYLARILPAATPAPDEAPDAPAAPTPAPPGPDGSVGRGHGQRRW